MDAEEDRLVPDPRETSFFVGHAAAERTLLESYRAGRLHHAWLLAGPPGIGKATLAFRFARFLLEHPDPAAAEVRAATDLSVEPDSPSFRRIVQRAHPDLAVVERAFNPERKTRAAEIGVADVRRAAGLFSTTSGAGGWRLAIVDTAEDLNANAANALLKIVEEPPPRSVFFLLAASARRLPATLRSRCRVLRLDPLATAEVAVVLEQIPNLVASTAPEERARAADRAGGSVGRAVELLGAEQADLGRDLEGLLAALPRLDTTRALALADLVATRGLAGLEAFTALVLDHAHRRAVAAANEPPGGRLAPWAEVWEKVANAGREVEIYNLDRRPFVLSTLTMLAAAAR